MPARRTLASALAAAVTIAIVAPTVSAQFTPRFQTRERGEPVQWHVGIGVTVVNLGDYTSETWPKLDAPAPIFHGRVGVAIPLKGDELFIMPELEGNTAGTQGAYVYPLDPTVTYTIPEVGQRGFSVMLNLVRAYRERRVLLGAGMGFHMVEHDPVQVPAQDPGVGGNPFHRDPFNHIGIGAQLHYARSIGELAENRRMMLEVRYKVALMSGNVSDRNLLMSEFQVTLYMAIK